MTDRSPLPRVFLLGLDGATFTLLRPWAEAGHLPTFRRLMAEGAWGPLASTTPASTPIAWASMITGVYPGKHGIFGFVKRRPHGYELDVVTAADRRRPAIWNILDRHGLRSTVVDVPFTYPPEPINGIMVSGLGTPDVASPFVHPPSLREVILREFSPYPLDVYFRGDVFALLDDARRLTEHRLALCRFLLREFPWAFAMLGLMATDRVQHVVWRFVDPAHSRYSPEDAARYGPAVLDYYRRLDDAVAELVAAAGRGTTVLVASDHGFGPMERSLSLLRWLGQEGLVVLGGRRWAYRPPDEAPPFTPHGPGRVIAEAPRGTDRPGGLTFVVDRPDAFAGAVFRLSGLDPHRRYELTAEVTDATPDALLEFDDLTRDGNTIIGGGPVHACPAEVTTVFQPSRAEIDLFVCLTTYNGNPTGRLTVRSLLLAEREDWSRSVAYVLDSGVAVEGRRIRLNVRGREPHGIVAPGEEYERVRERIVAGMLALRDEAGRPLVQRVYRREELYRGPYAEEGPDLVALFAEGVGGIGPSPELAGYSFDGPISMRLLKGNSGNHRPDGIFIAWGERIRRGQAVRADIVDVAPTVLHLLGVPAPADTDGRALAEIEVSGGRPATAPAPTPAGASTVGAGATGPEGGPSGVYDAADRRRVEDRLRRLGYLE